MSEASEMEVRAGLKPLLPRLWRYALTLSGQRDAANDLVQSACLRALERAHQFSAGSSLDRWIFSILRSIWFNELRARRIRAGGGFLNAEDALSFDGAQQVETNILAGQVLKAIGRLPEAQREAVLLVYGEGLTYAQAAEIMGAPIGTIMSRLAAARAALSALK